MRLYVVNLRTYKGIQEKTACICDCNANYCIQEEKEGKMISQYQINPTRHYQENIPLDLTQKQRNKEQFRPIQYPIAKENNQEPPSGVANSITKRNFLWLGGTTTGSMTPRIIFSQYARTVSKSNTKEYRIIPYSGQLKQIPVELFQCSCNYNFLSTTTNKESMIYINVLEIFQHI